MHRLFRIFLLFSMTIFMVHTSFGQYGKKMNQKKLNKDFERAIDELKKTHPALYRFVSTDSLENLITASREDLKNVKDQLGFYKLLCPIYSAVGDGHTKILVDEYLYDDVLSDHGIFPYTLWLNEDNRLFVIDNAGHDNQLKLGDEIIGIDGRSVQEFVNQVNKYISYEQIAYRNSLIAHNFSWLNALITDPDGFVNIQVTGDLSNKRIGLTDYWKWKKEKVSASERKFNHLFDIENNEYKILGGNIGYLKIHEFGSYKLSRYENQVKKIFDSITEENISSLIIDLRGNSGGDPNYVESLIHSVSDIAFCRTEMIFQVRNGPASRFYESKYVKKDGDASNKNYLYFGAEKAFRQPKDVKNEFTGDLYLLIDEDSHSATTSMASVFKCYDLGVIVGNTSGGTRIFQAYSQPMKLPKSNFTCYVSSTLLYTSCSGFHDDDGYKEGIEPHYVVNKELEDFISDSDSQLDFVINLIREKEQD